MKNEIKKLEKEEAKTPLLIFCFDTVAVYDKTTFFSHLFQGLRITHWHESMGDENTRLAGIFDMLFEEVMVRRNEKKYLPHKQ